MPAWFCNAFNRVKTPKLTIIPKQGRSTETTERLRLKGPICHESQVLDMYPTLCFGAGSLASKKMYIMTISVDLQMTGLDCI